MGGTGEKYLSVKTRGGVSPQGKQRVFLCGLKEDVKQYLDGIADDILKLFDCAVWYENPGEDYDDGYDGDSDDEEDEDY